MKLREREGQRVNLGRSLKGLLWMVDGDGGMPFPELHNMTKSSVRERRIKQVLHIQVFY